MRHVRPCFLAGMLHMMVGATVDASQGAIAGRAQYPDFRVPQPKSLSCIQPGNSLGGFAKAGSVTWFLPVAGNFPRF